MSEQTPSARSVMPQTELGIMDLDKSLHAIRETMAIGNRRTTAWEKLTAIRGELSVAQARRDMFSEECARLEHDLLIFRSHYTEADNKAQTLLCAEKQIEREHQEANCLYMEQMAECEKLLGSLGDHLGQQDKEAINSVNDFVTFNKPAVFEASAIDTPAAAARPMNLAGPSITDAPAACKQGKAPTPPARLPASAGSKCDGSQKHDLQSVAHSRMLDTLGMGSKSSCISDDVLKLDHNIDSDTLVGPTAYCALSSLHSPLSLEASTLSAKPAGHQLSNVSLLPTLPVSSVNKTRKLSKAERKVQGASKKLHSLCDNLTQAMHKEWENVASNVKSGSTQVTELMRVLWEWYKDDRQSLQQVLNVGDASCITPMHKAVMMDDPSARLVQFLVHAGADVNVTDEEGNTPLIVAGYFDNSMESVKQCACTPD
mmetsp:Transcript_21083/g.40257  ORF Transcript_21083/g.40257 Transcript_21083/m.40257 type:complete len:429 (-) Transcript_21083:1177-2463(-)